jgi:cellobiose phosphorylase
MKQVLTSIDKNKTRDLLLKHMQDKTKSVINYNSNKVHVQYTSPDGRTFTWLPEENRAVTGTWRIEDTTSGDLAVCFQADNVAQANCIPSAYILSEYCSLDVRDKDAFSLQPGNIPYLKEFLNVPGLLQ